MNTYDIESDDETRVDGSVFSAAVDDEKDESKSCLLPMYCTRPERKLSYSRVWKYSLLLSCILNILLILWIILLSGLSKSRFLPWPRDVYCKCLPSREYVLTVYCVGSSGGRGNLLRNVSLRR
jgi:hypothetical protein